MATNQFTPKYDFDIPSHLPQKFDQDALGYQHYANAICEVLCKIKKKNNGVTIGIFGDWGAGKTTVLNMVSEILPNQKSRKHKEGEFLIVKFSAWHYLKQEELWLALIRSITLTIEEKLGLGELVRLNAKLWWDRTKRNPIFYVHILRYFFAIILTLLGIALSTYFMTYILRLNIPMEILQKYGQDWSFPLIYGGSFGIMVGILTFFWSNFGKSIYENVWKMQGNLVIPVPPLNQGGFDQQQVINVDEFRRDFRTIAKTFGNLTIIVMIDDLDRCPSDQIIPVLEAIKRFGFEEDPDTDKDNLGRIAFILAADRRAIENAVHGYFKDYREKLSDIDAKFLAREYVEKIVQIPFTLPPLTRARLGNLYDRQKDLIPVERTPNGSN